MKSKHIIYEMDNFCVFVPDTPHIDRCDGGHVVIIYKGRKCHSLIEMPDAHAKELICLAKYCGKALAKVLGKEGIEVGIVNFQINGNWSVNNEERDPLHMHVYGRAKSSLHQKYGEALHFPNPDTGFYDSFVPLHLNEAKDIGEYLAKKYAE